MGSLVHQRFDGLELAFSRLGTYPTSLEPLQGLGVGANLWCKREDLSAVPYGGNKIRKLEWLLPDACERGDTVLSMGATGSNHLVATAIHGGALNLKVHALVVPQPVTDHVRDNARLLSHKAERIWPAKSRAAIPWVGMMAWGYCRGVAQGEPTWIPAGGSSPLGTVGWVDAALEIGRQVESGEMPRPTDVFVPFGSGGTAAGLWLGMGILGWETRLHAVRVMDWPYVRRGTLVSLARKTRVLLNESGASVPEARLERLVVDDSAIGDGYGHATDEGLLAMEQAGARGIHLEPTYTAKALAACLRAMSEGRTGSEVLFVDTLNSRPLAPLLAEAPEDVVPDLASLLG